MNMYVVADAAAVDVVVVAVCGLSFPKQPHSCAAATIASAAYVDGACF